MTEHIVQHQLIMELCITITILLPFSTKTMTERIPQPQHIM